MPAACVSNSELPLKAVLLHLHTKMEVRVVLARPLEEQTQRLKVTTW